MIQQPLRDIIAAHPVPAESKINKRLASLERMQAFYETKVSTAGITQFRIFREYVVAIVYAITVIKMYRKLTKRLAAELEREANNGKDSTD